MIRYVSGSKKEKVEREIYACKNRIGMSQLLMIPVAVFMVLSWMIALNFFNTASVISIFILIILVSVVFISSNELKELEKELEKVKDDVHPYVADMTLEEVQDYLAEQMAEEIIKSGALDGEGGRT